MEMSSSSGNVRSELRDDAKTIKDSATQYVHGEVDARKDGAASQAKTLSSALGRAAGELDGDSPSWVRLALNRASQTVEQLADAVEQKDSRQLTQDVQRMARQHPGSFLAACAFAGFAAARVMQAGTGSQGTSDQGDTRGGQQDGPAMDFAAPADPYATRPLGQGAAL